MHAKCLGHSTGSSSSWKKQTRTHSSCPVVSSCSNCSVNSSSNGSSSSSNGNGSKRFLWIRGTANRILSHHTVHGRTRPNRSDATAALIINLYKLPMCARRLPPFSDFDAGCFPLQFCACVRVCVCEECIK